MNEWTSSTLREHINLLTGHPFESKKYSNDKHDVKLLRGDNIIQGGLRWQDVKRWSKSETKDFERYQLKVDDVVLAMDRPWIGAGLKYASISLDDLPCLLLQRTARLRGGKGLDTRYLKYIIGSLSFSKYIQRITTGSVVPHISSNQIKDFPVLLPPIAEQKNIAEILCSLDKKIELNNKINSKLEGMAKLIYDYWFVQFDFPNANGKRYKSSGGKMVYNEELKRDIPDGWKVKKMGDVLEKNTNKFSLNNEKHSISTIDLSIMPSNTMCLTAKNLSNNFKTNLFKMKKFDILFGGIRPYLLKAGFAPFDGLNTGTVHSYSVKNKNQYNFALLTMTHESMFNFAVANSKGTKMPVIGSDDLLEYKIPYNEEIIEKFNTALNFRDTIAHNIIENHKLTECRDWLLPMLMNGQVTVKDV